MELEPMNGLPTDMYIEPSKLKLLYNSPPSRASFHATGFTCGSHVLVTRTMDLISSLCTYHGPKMTQIAQSPPYMLPMISI